MNTFQINALVQSINLESWFTPLNCITMHGEKKKFADAYDVTRLFQFGLLSASLYSVPLYGGDVFGRSSLHCLSLVQLPYLFCMFPVSHCQDLVLFAVCLLGVFVPSPFCNVLCRFSLSL